MPAVLPGAPGWSRAPPGGLSLGTAYEQNQAWEVHVKLSLPWRGRFLPLLLEPSPALSLKGSSERDLPCP